MMRCHACSGEIRQGEETCPSCSTPRVATDLETAPGGRALPVGRRDGAGRPSPRRRFAAGDLLSERYRIVQLLGRGGMGEVYLADDLTLEQPVALKLLPAGLERDARLLARLTDEVTLARRVTHASVCRVYDIGSGDGLHFLSMEYIDGENLSSLLRRVGRLPADRAIEVGVEICGGLEAAHAAGILHRDLKPGNLMIDGRGRVKVTDFGLADPSSASARDGVLMGTPAYMAPELFHGEPATVQSDLYALGLVLYQVFTGRRADERNALSDAADPRSRPAPQRPSELVESLSPALDDVVLACLAPDPKDRPASASVVADALAAAADSRTTQVKTLVFTQVAEVPPSAQADYDALVRRLIRDHEALRLDAEGHLRLVLDRPQDGVHFALAYHHALRALTADHGGSWDAGVAIHLGELRTSPADWSGGHRFEIARGSEEKIAGLVRLASPGQTLLSRGAFDLARQSEETQGADLSWLAHGTYEVEGLQESLHVFEVGVGGAAPLSAPSDGPGFRRQLLQPAVAGWRPAVGLELPQRPHWIMERRLGEGGFGEVWLAKHRKTHEQRVFKFCYDEERLRALKREITLFRLLKENLGERDDITRIFDWNFDQSPFFIEAAYTAGGSLADWVEAMGGSTQIPLETRLDIVAQVATALAAAHSVGVLHKDVKPANVLITVLDDGRVRAQLSDFGVGLLTEHQRLAEAGITALGMTELPDPGDSPSSDSGTRLYTAPELMEGKPASLQADVYALGVVLYQLVVSDFSRVLAPGWEREVDDELLREDIAAAVDGSPEERLADARRLADRLARLDERRRELAERRRMDAEARRTRQALVESRRRRKVALAAVGGMVVAIAVAIALWIQSQRIARQAEASKTIAQFLVALFESPDPYRDEREQLTAREILDRGTAEIEGTLAYQPEIQAQLMHIMGTVYQKLGHPETSGRLLEKALAIRRTIHRSDSHPEVLESLNALAHALNKSSRYEEAEAMARQALDTLQSSGRGASLEAAASWTGIAEALFETGRFPEAGLAMSQALEIKKAELGERHAEVADELQSLAVCLVAQGRYDAAEPLYRQSLGIYREIHGERHPTVGFGIYHLGILMRSKQDFPAAETYFRQALERLRETLGEEHPRVVASRSHLARAIHLQGRYDEALRLYGHALTINRQSSGSNQDTAEILKSMALAHRDRGDHEASRTTLLEALMLYRRHLGDEHYRVAQALRELAGSHVHFGDYAQAESVYREAWSMFARLLGDDHWQIPLTTLELGEMLLVNDEPERAEPVLRSSVEGLEANFENDHARVNRARSNLGECLTRLGQFSEAERLLQAALELQVARQPGIPGRRDDRRDTLERLVALYTAMDLSEKADLYRDRLAR